MQNAFDKRKEELKEFDDAMEKLNLKKRDKTIVVKQVPSDLMDKCNKCGRFIVKEDLVANLMVCPYCGHHKRLSAKERLNQVLDPGYEIILNNIEEKHLDFPDYKDKLDHAREETGDDESVVCASGMIDGIKVLVGVMNSYFMMGSMGSVTGEKITRLFELGNEKKLPVIMFTCSGGARMQEGVISLMQMAKTSEAVGRFNELYIAVLTDPTTGGVSASFATLADITLAEPKALVGFAGKRVIERTIKETLPDEFQTAEFLLEKGFLDAIVSRKDLKKKLNLLLRLHNYR